MSTSVDGGDSDVPQDFGTRVARLSPAQRAALTQLLAADAREDTEPSGQPRNSTERTLVDIWRAVLRVDRVGVEDSFFALGGDSIASLQISARAGAAGLRLTSRQVLECETIARLAAVASTGASAQPVPDEPTGLCRLTPIQRWFFEQNLSDSHHWDQTVSVEAREPLDVATLRAALRAATAHHDALRSRFVRNGGEWRQEVRAEAPDPDCDLVDLSSMDSARWAEAIRSATAAVQSRIDLATGPLLSAVLFTFGGDGPDRLLLAVHHLVVDGVAMRVLLEDVDSAYRALREGRPVTLPPRTLSWRGWAEQLARYAGSDQIRRELDYWRGVPSAEAATVPLARDTDEPNTVGGARRASASLPPEMVAAIRRDVLPIPGVALRDILLSAFLTAWRDLTAAAEVQLDLESHGREPLDAPVDVSRTVGWFTALYPVRLHLLRHERGLAAVRSVSRQLAAVPGNGVGYGLLRYLDGPDGATLADLPASPVTFNYLGWFDRGGPTAVLGPPVQVPGLLQSDAARRRHLIDVVVSGVGDTVQLEVIYPGAAVADADARRLLARLVAAVGEVVEECRTGRLAEGSRDFALMRVDARQMAEIGRQIGT